MSKSIAEVLTEHGSWRYTNGAGTPIVCSGCGASVGNVIEHQAEMLEAEGFGYVCPFDCDSCHSDECPCDRSGCGGPELLEK